MLDFIFDYFTMWNKMWNRLLRKVVSEAITWFYFRKKKEKNPFLFSYWVFNYICHLLGRDHVSVQSFPPLPSKTLYLHQLCRFALYGGLYGLYLNNIPVKGEERSCSSLFIACVTFYTLSHWFQVAIKSCWIVRTLTEVIWSTRSSINLTHCQL